MEPTYRQVFGSTLARIEEQPMRHHTIEVEDNADHHATPAWCPACGSRQIAVDRANGTAECQDCLQHVSDPTD